MGAGLAKVFAPGVKRALSETQWEYIAFGPYVHWTGTRRALVKRGLYEEDGKTLTFLGDAVRQLVRADLPSAQVDRNPEGHDPEEGHGRNDESPVAATSGDAPKGVGHAQ